MIVFPVISEAFSPYPTGEGILFLLPSLPIPLVGSRATNKHPLVEVRTVCIYSQVLVEVDTTHTEISTQPHDVQSLQLREIQKMKAGY